MAAGTISPNEVMETLTGLTAGTTGVTLGPNNILRRCGNLVLLYVHIKTTAAIEIYRDLITGLPDHASLFVFPCAANNGKAYRLRLDGTRVLNEDDLPANIWISGFAAYALGFDE